MDKGDMCKYLVRIMQFDEKLLSKDFGVKNDWCRYFEPHKMNDKNLLEMIDWFIRYGVLQEYGYKNGKYRMYRPTIEGKLKAQHILEHTDIWLFVDSAYDITRNPKKGSQNL